MKIKLYAPLFALALLAQSAGARPLSTPARGNSLQPAEVAELRAGFDQNLGQLRAGRIDAPAALASSERAALCEAQLRATDLHELRAGNMSDHEWTMIGLGAAIVLILIWI